MTERTGRAIRSLARLATRLTFDFHGGGPAVSGERKALSAIGLYAVVAFAVEQRTREIGIRTALGAQRRQVVGIFFTRGLGLSVLGLAIGLPLGLLMLRVLSAQVGTPQANPFVLTTMIAAVVIIVAALATWIPSSRAARIDPLAALRVET